MKFRPDTRQIIYWKIKVPTSQGSPTALSVIIGAATYTLTKDTAFTSDPAATIEYRGETVSATESRWFAMFAGPLAALGSALGVLPVPRSIPELTFTDANGEIVTIESEPIDCRF